jgi:hypothetical protein
MPIFLTPLKRLTLIFAASASLVACTSNPTKDVADVELPPPAIRSFALIRVLDPVEFTAENRGAPLHMLGFVGWAIQKNIDDNRENTLANVFAVNDFHPGKELSEALHRELTRRGYHFDYLVKVPRDPEDPLDIEYDKIQSDADAYLVVAIDEMGVYSGMTSTKFAPRLNVDVEVLGRRDEYQYFQQSIQYGVDAGELSDEEIPADGTIAYSSFGEALEHSDALVQDFRSAIEKIAASIARQLDERGVATAARMEKPVSEQSDALVSVTPPPTTR